MDGHTVFVIGDSLFAETLAQMLRSSGGVEVSGAAPSLHAALPLLANLQPDVVVVAHETHTENLDPLLITYPDLNLIHADLNTDHVSVIVSRQIGAHAADLLAAIAGLPKRR